MEKKYDSLIFDLDGTLWDASETVSKAFEDSLLEIGIENRITPKDVRKFSGMQMNDIFEKHFQFINKDNITNFQSVYDSKEKDYLKKFGAKLYPDLENTLLKLKEKYQLYIVSNCMKGYIETFLDIYKLNSLFSDLECYGNNGLSKAENIQKVIVRNHLQKPVYIGDTIWDQTSAAKAKLDFIFAEYGFGEAKNPEISISKFQDLLIFL